MAAQLQESDWRLVNDKACESGDKGIPPRERMEELLRDCLAQGEQRVVVDRPNMETRQRARWLKITRDQRVPDTLVAVVYLDTPLEECQRRVVKREHHRLAADEKSLKVIQHFVDASNPPWLKEGFGAIFHIQTSEKAAGFIQGMA